MYQCPYCQAALPPRSAACPRCRADMSPLFGVAVRPTLVARGPGGVVATFTLADGTYRVGCADPADGHRPDLDLSEVDADQVVSRRHVLLRVRGGRAYLVEESLTGGPDDRTRYAAGQRGRAGTTVGGVAIRTTEVEWPPTTEARFGSVVARLEWA